MLDLDPTAQNVRERRAGAAPRPAAANGCGLAGKTLI
jgi:hypothetical protein